VKKILSAIANELRIQMLKKLSKEGLSFTELMQELNMSPKTDAGKFGYHLKTLVEAELIAHDKSSGKYVLTELGKLIMDLIWELEEVSLKRSRKILVRTSSLTIEPFERRKIVEALMREAKVPRKLAERIALEAEERILQLDIKYLTAPLIREFVNAILIEQGLEDYRHAMTRLGLPVYDVEQLIEKKRFTPTIPDEIHVLAGDAVMSEYTLLRQLPRRVADAHLSGAIHISNTNYWTLRPATLHHDALFFLKNGLKLDFIGAEFSSMNQPKSFGAAINLLFRTAYMMQSNLAVGQVIDDINYVLAPFIKDMDFDEIVREIRVALLAINQLPTSRGKILPLAIGLSTTLPRVKSEFFEDFIDEAHLVFRAFIKAMCMGDDDGKPFFTPLPLIKLGRELLRDEISELFMDACKLTCKWFTPYFINMNARWQGEVVSYGWDLSRLEKGRVEGGEEAVLRTGCLGSVFINLPRIALEANGEDDAFFDQLNEVIKMCMEALRRKYEIIEKRLSMKMLPLLSIPTEDGPYYRIENAIYNIGYAGLPEAVKMHTGFWPHEDKHSFVFAKRVVNFMRRRISKLRGRWCLTSVALEDVGGRFFKNDMMRYGYSSIREKIGEEIYTSNAHVPLHAKVSLIKRAYIESVFQERTRGGHGLNIYIKEPAPNPEYMSKTIREIIEKTNIGAFTISRDWTYCTSCGELTPGKHNRCLKCNRALKGIVYYLKRVNVYEVAEDHEVKRVKYIL